MSDKIQTDDKSKAALEYHSTGRPGKIEVISTKPCATSRDLSLAYTPGVAAPCLAIAKDPELAYKYTSKGNLVAVISNGTAVLGLGDIGPQASKPVMEGKGILFKRFADIDVFDIEINAPTVKEMVDVISALGPTFGGINLEDIKAPECFEVETQLIEKMNIPVFHDDQHGTAIIATAAFVNALEITKRKIGTVKVVFSGAGAAAIACAKLFKKLGVRPENLLLCDSKGVIYKGRKDGMNIYKEEFSTETSRRSLADAMKDADAFIGCSARGVLTKDMVATMAKNPIIFAMANPEPEILPEEVAEVRSDAIMATGRSDYPNQVNNVLGFPFIFRGALDVRASKINEEMKLAAVYALANLAKEEVPDEVRLAYGNESFTFGPNYLIPKPFDRRVLTRVAPAVAEAACKSGVARMPITDFKQYARELEARLGSSANFIRVLRERIDIKNKPKILFAEGAEPNVLKAVEVLLDEGVIQPVLLGNVEKIKTQLKHAGMNNLDQLEIIAPKDHPQFAHFAEQFYMQRKRKGVSRDQACNLMRSANYFGPMMVKQGFADGLLMGLTQSYSEAVSPLLQVVGTRGPHKAAGIYILVIKNRVLFLADCTMQVEPNEEELADIAISASQLYRELMRSEPRVAFLSYSNFGSSHDEQSTRIRRAVQITKQIAPTLKVEGEMQADVAVNYGLMSKLFDFAELDKAADVLIFPNLQASNICYKLLSQLANAEVVGPIIVPLDFTLNVLQRTATATEIVHMATVTGLLSQIKRNQ